MYVLEPPQEIIVIDDPRTLVAQAEHATAEQAAVYLLLAVAGLIDAQQYPAAQQQLERLAVLPLDAPQQQELAIQSARLRQAQGDHPTALAQLQALYRQPGLASHYRRQVGALLADSQLALGRQQAAVISLIGHDAYLQNGEQQRNQARIIQLINALNPLSLSLLRESTEDRLVEGWIALADVLLSTGSGQQGPALQYWQSLYPNHPARPEAIVGVAAIGRQKPYTRLALLLPLTSADGGAAQAFYDGFLDSHARNRSVDRPLVQVYDIGEDAQLAHLYYQAALNDGAEFIVGPLGRQAVGLLLDGYTPTVPTLVVGEIPAQHQADNLFGISLSPEPEARQVAERAFADGHRQAGLLYSDADWSQRAAGAFADHWQQLGGTIAVTQSFARDNDDYAQLVRQLLGIDHSVARHQRLSAQLNRRLRFNPRRRDDMDFLFLAIAAERAPLIVPQIRFSGAHDLPLYAMSNLHSGRPNPAADADLDGVIFGDIHWMLRALPLPATPAADEPDAPANGDSRTADAADSAADNGDNAATEQPPLDSDSDSSTAEPASAADPDGRQPPQPQNRYRYTALARLYALGFESYLLIPQLNRLRANSWLQHQGEMMHLGIDRNGNARRQLVWSTFNQGRAVRVPPALAAPAVN